MKLSFANGWLFLLFIIYYSAVFTDEFIITFSWGQHKVNEVVKLLTRILQCKVFIVMWKAIVTKICLQLMSKDKKLIVYVCFTNFIKSKTWNCFSVSCFILALCMWTLFCISLCMWMSICAFCFVSKVQFVVCAFFSRRFVRFNSLYYYLSHHFRILLCSMVSYFIICVQ